MNKRQSRKFLKKAEQDLRHHMRRIAEDVATEANKGLAGKVRFTVKEQPLGFDFELLIDTLGVPYVAHSPQHLRRLAHKTVTVRAHDKTYKPGFMPIAAENNRWFTVNIDNYKFGYALRDAYNKVERKLKLNQRADIAQVTLNTTRQGY